jgi:signal transduction histidine kinase
MAEEHKLVDAENPPGGPDPLSAGNVRERLKQILIFGIVLNFATSLLLALYFSRTITGRLNVLVENTSRLVKKEKLLPTLQGEDEIAHLDAVFHQMASSLEEVQRLKQDFVNMISHDLKTPLTSIVGNLALVSADAFGPLSERGKHIVSTSEKQAARLVSLINDLLLLEKIEAGGFELHLTKTELSDIVSEAIDAVSQTANQRSITIETQNTEAQIVADAMRLEQVLINLLSNAIKFSPDHSVIKVLVEETPEALEVKVVDQGRGVPAAHRKDIFEKFKQVEASDSREKGGTGLGLPICKLIIEKHGGTIGVDSEEGKGSTFWFRIPHDIKSNLVSPAK